MSFLCSAYFIGLSIEFLPMLLDSNVLKIKKVRVDGIQELKQMWHKFLKKQGVYLEDGEATQQKNTMLHSTKRVEEN